MMATEKLGSMRASAEFPYQLQAEIGRGAMGVVYRAFEPELKRQVAIKFMSETLLAGLTDHEADALRLRFLQEARAAAALSHPAVTTIYRIGEYRQRPYMAMEWLDGQDLETLFGVEDFAPSTTQVVRWMIELLEALSTAHRMGIVHRDIKPANLMILNNQHLKVTDFGIAQVQGSQLIKTQVGALIGTPHFASPEQLTGETIDGRADLYSVGVVLYQALTGRLPYNGKNFGELLNQALTMQPPPPSLLNPTLSHELDVVIKKALAKDPNKRFANAEVMIQALAPFVRAHHVTLESPRVELNATFDYSAIEGWELDPKVPTFTSASDEVILSLEELIRSWPSRHLDTQATQPLILRLLERPLHAEPFSGVLAVGRTYLLIHTGLILGAFDAVLNIAGDEAIDALPSHDVCELFNMPEGQASSLLGLLATLVNPRDVRQANLDPSIVNVAALASKLQRESFKLSLIHISEPTRPY